MRLLYKSKFYKFAAVTRFYLAKWFYGERFSCAKMSMIGKRNGIHIFKGGKITCSGRIILADDNMLFAKGKISLGNNFGMNQYGRIIAHEEIVIGDQVTLGQMVSILDHDHQYHKVYDQLKLDGYKTAPIHIGSNIWIGDKCTILKGVTIGDNVVIGAHTLVNKDVPSNVVIAGNPFKILKNL